MAMTQSVRKFIIGPSHHVRRWCKEEIVSILKKGSSQTKGKKRKKREISTWGAGLKNEGKKRLKKKSFFNDGSLTNRRTQEGGSSKKEAVARETSLSSKRMEFHTGKDPQLQ